MAKLNKVPQHLKERITEIRSVAGSSKEEVRRLELWEDVNSIYREPNGNIDVLSAINLMAKLDSGFGEEFAYETQRAGFKDIAEEIEKYSVADGYKRAAEPISSTTFNGDEDLSTQYVEKSITKRMEDDLSILKFVFKKTGSLASSGKNKSAKFPIWDSTFAPTPKAVGANLDDFTDDTTGGIVGLDHKVVEAYKIGLTMDFEAESYLKLDPAYLAEIVSIGKGTLARGIKANVYLGNGSAPNATGMWTNATSVTYATSIANTIKLMLASVGDASRGGQGYFLLTNTAGAAALAFEKLNNDAYNVNINLGKPGLAGSVMGLPVIIDDSFQASGSSPAKSAPLYLGSIGKYFYVDGGLPTIVANPYADFKSGEETTRIMAFVGGDVDFDNSFAKTSIPNVY